MRCIPVLYAHGMHVWQQCRALRCSVIVMARPWRPDIDDVDRLSRGDGAKRRGTGNFNIPHRLNNDERPLYESAKKKGYLAVRGTGYRKGRKGNPLPNSYRQWCDAKATACVVIEQDMVGSGKDVVVVDLAPLRTTQLSEAVRLCHELATAAGASSIPPGVRPLEAVPFNTIPTALPFTVQQLLYPGTQPSYTLSGPTPELIAAAEAAVMQQADVVRQLKSTGLDNSHPKVQREVQVLLGLKDQLQQLLGSAGDADPSLPASRSSVSQQLHEISSIASTAGSNSTEQQQQQRITAGNSTSAEGDGSSQDSISEVSSSRKQTLYEDNPFANVAIWQLPAIPLFFEADRTIAKELAKNLCSALASMTPR